MFYSIRNQLYSCINKVLTRYTLDMTVFGIKTSEEVMKVK